MSAASDAPPPARGPVLIVEDEGIVAMHLERELRAQGYDVLEPVASGEAAIAAARAPRPAPPG